MKDPLEKLSRLLKNILFSSNIYIYILVEFDFWVNCAFKYPWYPEPVMRDQNLLTETRRCEWLCLDRFRSLSDGGIHL